MANTETDRLDLVQIMNFKGGLFTRLFGLSKNISVADGFSIEVFRGGRHLGSILSRDVALVSDIVKNFENIGVRKGDTLIRVNLGAKLITLSGNLTTLDGYEPSYIVTLELRVVNPRQFAMRYLQQDDPVRIAQAALEGEFRRYAVLHSHDRLRTNELRYLAEYTLNVGTNKDIGLDVMRVHDVTILMDRHLQKERHTTSTENPNRTKVAEEQKTVTEQKSIDVPVTHEEVYIERRPASGQPSDTPIGEGETYSVPVREEQVTVEKQPVVREEVAMGKRQVQDTQQDSDTVCREEARDEEQKTQAIQNEYSHDEHMRITDAQTARRWLDSIPISKHLAARIREEMESGLSLDEIVAEHAELLNIFNGVPSPEQAKEDQVESSSSTEEQRSSKQKIKQEEQIPQATLGKYNVQIGEGKGIVIGDYAHVTNSFGGPPDSNEEQKEADEDRLETTLLPRSQLRHLHARLPERVRVGDRIPLQVRVALSPAQNRSTLLRPFSLPPQGADLKLVLDCPSFLLHSASMTTVHVVNTADSDWVLFELEALHEGVYTLEISAFNEGAFLGTLSLQLTVDSLAIRGQSVDHFALLPLRSSQKGEVTLVIHYDPVSAVYRYQLRSASFGETDELRSGPLRRKQEEAIADLIALLNEQARDLTGYSAEETRRWLQGKGIELWNELIPKELGNLFWEQRDNIKVMTILSAGDPMPWEVMYPTNEAGDDAGFLAEQFPIVRWIFGPAPTTQLQCSRPFFIAPDDASLTTEGELAALRRILGEGQKIDELTPLLSLLDTAEFDALHFACHNIFRADSPTSSSIQLGSKRFVPTFLNKYNGHFRRRSPLVFMNACRSDGMAANYTWLAGWARSFLTAGAGAFIGSLWEVRDSTAGHFAEEFYRNLCSGVPLGDAMRQARTAVQNEPGDPTWLAYTLYGNPSAVLLKGDATG